jgi:hypothetical protein
MNEHDVVAEIDEIIADMTASNGIAPSANWVFTELMRRRSVSDLGEHPNAELIIRCAIAAFAAPSVREWGCHGTRIKCLPSLAPLRNCAKRPNAVSGMRTSSNAINRRGQVSPSSKRGTMGF